MASGGAERVAAILCNHWAAKGWDVTLATLDDGTAPAFYPVTREVDRAALGLPRNGLVARWRDTLGRVGRVRRLMRELRPDAVLSFIDETNVIALLAARGSGIPVVVAERIDPSVHRIPLRWSVLRRWTYPQARAVVVQTAAAAAYVSEAWGIRALVVPNPVPRPPGRAPRAAGDGTRRRIVAMGRLEPQKGFDLLVAAFASIATERSGWDLAILGDGPGRPAIERSIRDRGLEGRIALPGRTSDATGELARSDLFVLSSRFEGFPNALCEAMAGGLPVVAFDCPSGPREIVRDGVDGVLVPAEDVAALAAALAKLTADEGLRASLAARAPEVADRFAVATIADRWEALLSGRV